MSLKYLKIDVRTGIGVVFLKASHPIYGEVFKNR